MSPEGKAAEHLFMWRFHGLYVTFMGFFYVSVSAWIAAFINAFVLQSKRNEVNKRKNRISRFVSMCNMNKPPSSVILMMLLWSSHWLSVSHKKLSNNSERLFFHGWHHRQSYWDIDHLYVFLYIYVCVCVRFPWSTMGSTGGGTISFESLSPLLLLFWKAKLFTVSQKEYIWKM